ncbi:MAG: sulfur transferase domain-containing protein [Pseudomonas sp.]|uniref:beta-lactamase hydrolase domain-containing protein n=1 Tax=Pseudomonas sp. TaxID=306 RepID=UPI003391EAA2
MDIPLTSHSPDFSSSGQIAADDLEALAALGFRSIVCNRPDHEGGPAQPCSQVLQARCDELGLAFAYCPVASGGISRADELAFAALLEALPAPVLAFCRSGNRSSQLYRLTRPAAGQAPATACEVLEQDRFDVLVIGGGSAGIGVTASLLRRRPDLKVAVVEPSDTHYYQPAWTLVGGGAFAQERTQRPMASVIPPGAHWIKAAAAAFQPERHQVQLVDGRRLGYQQLIVCPGLTLAWERIEGLEQNLGRNGVTSNYRYDLAPYTWQLVRELKQGKALFCQPGMPIKCAGAPQKALYLSCDHWLRQGALEHIEVEFNLAGKELFGVAAFVPPLMAYMEKYRAQLAFNSNLVKVDGDSRTAWFESTAADGSVTRQAKSFDLLHVVPPQVAPDLVRHSSLANAAGWCEVDPATLQHPRYPDIFALGDACSAANAKTVAAARKQIVVVVQNLLSQREGQVLTQCYDGYGACPLTVERGKVVLAEFGYGGKLLPTFPLEPRVARRSAWWLKAHFLPWFYWNGMLKGREWLAGSSLP